MKAEEGNEGQSGVARVSGWDQGLKRRMRGGTIFTLEGRKFQAEGAECQGSESGACLACLRNSKPSVQLQQSEQGGSSRRRNLIVGGVQVIKGLVGCCKDSRLFSE